jgi:hypothetical protein
LVSRPHLPEEGPIEDDPAPVSSEAPEAGKHHDGDEAEGSLEERGSTTSPPPHANSEEGGLEKKRKCTDDLTSSSTSIPKNASKEPAAAREAELQIFEMLDS